MTIQVTKEPINLREKLNELETNKGLKGNEILQAETAQEVRSLIGAGRKNLIINGGMDVWQRGTSGFPNASSHNGFTADRFSVYSIGLHATPTKINVTGQDFNNAIRIANINSVNHWLELKQKIEDCEWLIGREVTLSFWAKADSATILGQVYTDTANTLTYNPTTSWARYSFTYTVTSGSILADGFMDITIGQSHTDGTGGNAIEFAQVQLELGSVATDFEHRSYGEELALCQRYYQKISSNGLVYTTYSTTQGYMQVPTPVQMRVLPSISWNIVDRVALASTSNITTNITYWSSYSNSPSSFFSFQARSSVALTSGLTYVMFPTAVTYMALNAEL